ncbi:nuclear transport factor 2 family protein [Algoriphagus confluentis]|uniref:DUF4440 domain-containing protein n=1 Tax=Algoriphagus confluentis TaxID=1697556 RepID=A0ABQ6PLM3_9BACT|nr:hypothetical protein Aconfl_10500 [Algoriphagus confluentis]
MSQFSKSILAGLLYLSQVGAVMAQDSMTYRITENYVPDDLELYNTIVKLDQEFFGYYNECQTQLEKYADFYAEDLEFYHDQGGLSKSKEEIVQSTQKNICGKVTRHLVPDSIEVYPIPGFGAVEMGLHYFINTDNPPDEPRKMGRFIVFWKDGPEGWKISKVVSLH